MDRLIRIAELWRWLPVFRAVAETENLRAAAERIGFTRSAVSRAVRSLEFRLGRPVFHRNGRRLQLNAEGEKLLVVVREAMRRLDDVVGTEGNGPHGALRVAASAVLSTAVVVPALAAVGRADGAARTMLCDVPHDADEALRSGEIDLAITSHPFADEVVELR